MTTEEARQNLEKADQRLSSAIEGLVSTRSSARQVCSSLQQAAESLQLVRKELQVCPPAGSLKPLIRSIKARGARVQLLLDSAAAFYCGAITAAAPGTCVYTPDGEMPRRADRGHLSFEG
jgi:hypothetical protein